MTTQTAPANLGNHANPGEPHQYEGRPLPHQDEPVFDQGLGFDVETISRRRVLQVLGFGAISAGMFTIAGCAPGTGSTAAPTGAGATTSPTSLTGASCSVIPEETAGPYPGDGTNGPDVLTESGVVRQDISSSFGSSTTKAEGIPLQIRLQVVDASNDCAPIPGAAVYLWHCNRDGGYSMYGQGIENENYLRGVQVAGDDGTVTYASIFPGCYSGRWPHIHFEVYGSLSDAADASKIIATSQIAMPADACQEAYKSAGYEASVSNLARVSLSADMVFGDDGGAHQIGTMSGTIGQSNSMVTLQVPVTK
ncbi:MAG TPA: intradiol ring-cleavage dioxygenase [Candidatus Limnocylindrales bacterium]|nr:intradiol ring-cleavage dioxygenase [Candidatus Limnocylindrales bacterium]